MDLPLRGFSEPISSRSLVRRRGRGVIPRESSAGGGQNTSVRDEGIKICQETWSQENCQKLDYIIKHESAWIVGRKNSEGCAGLSQACPASKMGEYAGTLRGEVTWTMLYMQNYHRKGYLGIDGAYRHKLDTGWW